MFFVARMWFIPMLNRSILIKPCKSLGPRREMCSNINSWCIPSRFHHIASLATHSNLARGMPSLVGIASKKYSSLQSNQLQQPEELETLYKWVELRCKGHDDAVLDSYNTFVSLTANELGIQVESVLKPKKKIARLTLLKSRHIYKKHMVQYEMRTYFRVITLKHLTGSTADVFLEYIERNLPEGVAMQVKKCHLEEMPSHLTPPTETPAQSSDDTSAQFLSASAADSNTSAQALSASAEDVSAHSSESSSDSSSSDSSDDEKPTTGS